MNIKIYSHKRYKNLIDKLGSKIQYVQLSTNNINTEAIKNLRLDGQNVYIIHAGVAANLITHLDKKLTAIELELKK